MANGLLDFIQSPEGIGLLSAAAGGLATARRGTPFNNLGRAGVAGLTGYAQAKDDIYQKDQLAKANELRDLQLQQAQLQIKQTQRGFDRETQIEDAAKSSFKPATPGTLGFGVPFNSPQSQQLIEQGGTNDQAFNADMLQGLNSSLEFSNKGPGVPIQAPSAGGFDNKAFLEKYREIDPIKAFQYEQNLKKQNAPVKVGKDDRLVDPLTYKELVGAAPEKIDYNKPFLPDGTPNLAYQDYSHKNKRAGAARTDIKIDNKTGESFAKEVGPIAEASYNRARAAVAKVQQGDRILEALDTGQVVTGSGANLRLDALRLANTLGVSGANDQEKLANTQQVIKGLSSITLEARQKLKGSGAITDRETDLLARAESGDINFSESELRRLIEINRLAAKVDYDDHQRLLTTMQGRPEGSIAPYFTPQAFPEPRKAKQNPSGKANSPYSVSSDSDYQAVPKGSYYTAPDGSLRKKK